MLTPKEKYDHAARLRRAINARKDADDIIKVESAILTDYVAETGDKTFRWDTLTLTYISGSPAKETVDYKRFFELAEMVMVPADYAALVARCRKMTTGRKPSFR